MKFLIEARLPALDGFLSRSLQSLLIEATFWVVVYIIFANAASRLLRPAYKRFPVLWERAKKRGGIFCGNGQDDLILLTIFAIHHGTAGTMMAFGTINEDAEIWRHGYLLETGLEVADLIALLFNMYPYRHDGIKSDIKVASIFHHLPGILLSGFVIDAGLHKNEHMRAIGMWLLLGACASSLSACYIYALDFNTQMKKAASSFVFAAVFFVYCRFYQFPKESYHLIQDVRSSEELNGTNVLKLLYFGATALSLFNFGITLDIVPKCVRYVKRAMDGVTPIETEPVPKSREDRMKRRRSSLMVAIDAIDQATRRRSSIASVMSLNAIEDVVRMEKEAHDIPDEDFAALSKTASSLKKNGIKVD